ncbi:hypothetical protein ABBQ38_015425 [Trebouxia sp. C0009 RCD-2024]
MIKAAYFVAVLSICLGIGYAQPFAPGQGLLPSGNLRTSDFDGPYNISLLSTQYNEIKAGIAAKQNYSDMDIVHFLTNVECLEGQFDTWGTFGYGFLNNLTLGGPTPLGARAANLTEMTRPFMEEVALNEQGHALFTRQAGSTIPCPLVDFDGGFNAFMGAAFGLSNGTTVEDQFGAPFDPFLNDQNFVLSVLSLEELGATGNKGLAGLTGNPVLANGIAGLATSATAQATVQRMLLWQMRNYTVEPFEETVQQVFARVSALRDSLDGPQFDDQGIVNTDARTIAVADSYVNMIPTDVRGLTFSRTPQMNINILTLGNPDGVGAFFPNGLIGAISKPTGFDQMSSGTDDFPSEPIVASQEAMEELGTIMDPLTADGPSQVVGQLDLTQSLTGPADNGTAATRGLEYTPSGSPNNVNTSTVQVGTPGGQY